MADIFTVPARVPIGRDAENRPVMIEPAWLNYLGKQVYERIGGVSAPDNAELVVDLHDDAGIEELKADLFNTRDGINQGPPPQPLIAEEDQAPRGEFPSPVKEDPSGRIEALEAIVYDLSRQINDIRQGTFTS